MRKLFKLLSRLIMVIICIFILSACLNSSPEVSVEKFFDALKKQDLKTAADYAINGNREFVYENEVQEKIMSSIFIKLDYQILSSSVNGDTAVVKTKVTSPDLVRVADKMVGDLMGQFFLLALSNNPNKDSKSQQLMEEYLINSLNDPNVPMTTIEVDINLKKDNNKWFIKLDDNLVNGITGNFLKAFTEIENIDFNNNSAKYVPDPNIYNVNDEAIYGRAAITVLSAELSKGNDFYKPQNGYDFLIVTLRERNVGDEAIEYNKNCFKIQNSLGQIIDPSFSLIDGETNLGSGILPAGGMIEGTIVFEVPENDSDLTLLFYPEDKALLQIKLSI